MTCNSYMGELQRMTQYKDKTAKGETGITAGLFDVSFFDGCGYPAV